MGRLAALVMTALLTGCVSQSVDTADDTPRVVSADAVAGAAGGLARPERAAAPRGWLVGVVLAEYEDYRPLWRVLADAGVVVLDASYRCAEADGPDRTAAVAEPGDLIAWSPKGDDQVVCGDEVRVLALAVASGGAG